MSSGTDMSREESVGLDRQRLQEALVRLRKSGGAWSLWLLSQKTPPSQDEWTLHQDLNEVLKYGAR